MLPLELWTCKYTKSPELKLCSWREWPFCVVRVGGGAGAVILAE